MNALNTTATRNTQAAWTRKATCTSMESGLFLKETAIAAYAKMEPSMHAPREDAERLINFVRMGLGIKQIFLFFCQHCFDQAASAATSFLN